MEILKRIAEALQQGDDEQVAALTRQAIAPGLAADDDPRPRPHRRHERRRREVPHARDLPARRAAGGARDVRRPGRPQAAASRATAYPCAGRSCIGTVQGDLHDIGKNLVGIMLRGAGFEVIDLGNDVAPERFVEAAESEGATVIGMSALLTTTMPVMQEVVDLVRARGLAGQVRTIVGGAPVEAEYAREIGADAYALRRGERGASGSQSRCLGRGDDGPDLLDAARGGRACSSPTAPGARC